MQPNGCQLYDRNAACLPASTSCRQVAFYSRKRLPAVGCDREAGVKVNEVSVAARVSYAHWNP